MMIVQYCKATTNQQSCRRPRRYCQTSCYLEYNRFKGGVDKLDQYLSYYNFNRWTRKWWRKTFLCLFDISITNAFIVYLHSELVSCKLTLLQFRVQLAKELLIETSHTELPSSSSTQSIRQTAHPPSARLTERHFPDKLQNRPNRKPAQRNCVVCSSKSGRRKTTVYIICKQCEVGVCVDPCTIQKQIQPAMFSSCQFIVIFFSSIPCISILILQFILFLCNSIHDLLLDFNCSKTFTTF